MKESEKKDKYLDFAREIKKKCTVPESDGETNCGWSICNNPQRIGKGTLIFEDKRTRRDHPDYSIFKIGQNTKKSPWNLRRLAVTRTPLRNYQLTLVWKTLKEVKDCHLNSSGKTSANAGLKNSQMNNIHHLYIIDSFRGNIKGAIMVPEEQMTNYISISACSSRLK